MSERRSAPRKPCVQLVDYFDGEDFYHQVFDNISTDGMFILTQNKPQVGKRLTLCFQLNDHPLEIDAEVIQRTIYGVGVRFISENPEAMMQVQGLVAEI